MNFKGILSNKQEEFIDYLIATAKRSDKEIPSIQTMSQELGISQACLREQMELARNLGLIKTQPRKGIEILPYRFTPAVIKSLYFAMKLKQDYFVQFSELRNHLEKIFFKEAAISLNESDLYELQVLVDLAIKQLHGNPIQLPHQEHREFHLMIYKRLENIFLNGLMEAYWDMYELVGLNVYADLSYLESVWDYHGRIVKSIRQNEINEAYELLISHMNLINQR